MRRTISTLAALAMAAAMPAHAAPAGPSGIWIDESGRGGIDIEPCGDKLCGTLVWLKNPLNEAGQPKTDIHNGDAALRARPLCGLKIMWDFSPDGDNAWSGGSIYETDSGSVYSSNMHLQDDGTLRVRGYVGISLLGKTQTWTRAPGALVHCK
jgi:uncharacterized protein (DUF2147 family)